MKKMKLVMVGNGMAGVRTLEELLKIAPELYDITVFGAEPHPNYNRILLSPVLAGEQALDEMAAEEAGAAGDKSGKGLAHERYGTHGTDKKPEGTACLKNWVLPVGVARVAFGGASPGRQCEAVDFGVVADVDGELGVEIKAFDGGGGGRGQGDFAQFTGEGMAFGRIEHGGFNHDRGELVGRVAETDQGAAGGAGMGAENLLAGFGVKEALGGRDAFDFSAAKPESTVVVEVTAVAETVINATGRGNFR